MALEIEEVTAPSGELRHIRVTASSLFTKPELAQVINSYEGLTQYPDGTEMLLVYGYSIFYLEKIRGKWEQ